MPRKTNPLNTPSRPREKEGRKYGKQREKAKERIMNFAESRSLSTNKQRLCYYLEMRSLLRPQSRAGAPPYGKEHKWATPLPKKLNRRRSKKKKEEAKLSRICITHHHQPTNQNTPNPGTNSTLSKANIPQNTYIRKNTNGDQAID